MTGRPFLLDNRADETRHSAALAYLVKDIVTDHPLSVATGYVNLGGLHHLATVVTDGRRTRLLLGAMPEQGLGGEQPLARFEDQLALLGKQRDFSRFPPSRAAERLQDVDQWLARDDVEVRRYVTRFLHGKAYLFGTTTDGRAALVTSANLTGAGLNSNLELGLVDYNEPQCRAALGWFDDLWNEAQPFTEELRDLLFPELGLIDPETVYLRALLDLYGAEEGVEPAPQLANVHLARFQYDGYDRARRILDSHGGVIYADGVGTGKTEVGLALIEQYAIQDGHNALVIAPAQLVKLWEERKDQARLPVQVVSFQQLASDEQLMPQAANARRHLHNRKDTYRLVLVDEAHALRNEDTTWYRAMERLLGGEPKHVVLLTATPVNNGLWDLYNLVMLFARHDRAFAPSGIHSIRQLFVDAGASERDPENLDPDVLFPLANAVSVRRDRPFIEAKYPDATFPNGTPVRFPKPKLSTARYDLDAAHPGLFEEITTRIDALTMARYTPTLYMREGAEERNVEVQLGSLLKSGILKRFESCWQACLKTVERLVAAHEAFLVGWDDHRAVPSGRVLRDAARSEADESGLATLVAEQLEADPETLPAGAFRDEYRDAVAADCTLLTEIRDRLSQLGAEADPKLALLRELLESSPARKIAVFASFGDTVEYLDEHLSSVVGARERVTVVGSKSDPDERTRQLGRFAPETVVAPGYEPPDGEVDLLISTDVLSEGQNLQQAQAVISYDMPWNPQRVVQRNGRVIRLLSPHDEVFLTTMLPEPGELEELLELEARVRTKIRAAAVYGMESEVIEGIRTELRHYAARIAEGDETLLDDDDDELSGAFLGELLRSRLDRAATEGELARVEDLPWGIGAAFRRGPGSVSRGHAGVFFAVRTTPTSATDPGHRYWRYVETEGERRVLTSELEMLRRIDPDGSEPADPSDVDLEAAWAVAGQSIVDEHNQRADPRRAQERIGAIQRWALNLLREPGITLPLGADRAAEALAAERSSAVRRALGDIKNDLDQEQISKDTAADRTVTLITDLGLQPVPAEEPPQEITIDDLGVVCWMAVAQPNVRGTS